MCHTDLKTPAGGRFTARMFWWLAFAILAGRCHHGRAQWLTQTNSRG